MAKPLGWWAKPAAEKASPDDPSCNSCRCRRASSRAARSRSIPSPHVRTAAEQGCGACGQSGRRANPCADCAGTGCKACGGSGAEQIDLLKLDEESMRRIRGDRIAMIFQDPGKALNPSLTIRDQVGEVFLQHRTSELVAGGRRLARCFGFAGRPPAPQGVAAGSRSGPPLPCAAGLRGHRNRLERALDDMIVRRAGRHADRQSPQAHGALSP